MEITSLIYSVITTIICMCFNTNRHKVNACKRATRLPRFICKLLCIEVVMLVWWFYDVYPWWLSVTSEAIVRFVLKHSDLYRQGKCYKLSCKNKRLKQTKSASSILVILNVMNSIKIWVMKDTDGVWEKWKGDWLRAQTTTEWMKNCSVHLRWLNSVRNAKLH